VAWSHLVSVGLVHIKEFGTAEDGRLFRAAQGGHLLSKEYGEVWKAARLAALTESETASPLADVRTHFAMRASRSGLSRASPRPKSPAGGPQHRSPVPLLRQSDSPQPNASQPANPTALDAIDNHDDK